MHLAKNALTDVLMATMMTLKEFAKNVSMDAKYVLANTFVLTKHHRI